MDEATTRRRAPSPSNTRKFVEADARSTDLLPKSSTSHARRPSTNFLQVREEPEFILHDLAGPYPVQNSPSRPARRPTRYKTLPTARLDRPPGTKLSQQAPKRRFRPTLRMQGELCTASATNTTSRENFIPHAVPLPVQNSPSKRPWQAHPVQNSPSHPARPPTRYKTLPARPKTPISAHFSHAGRTLYRFRHQHDEQGEKSHAPTPTAPQQRAPLQISHAIRLNELSTKPRNVAIPTT